MFRKLFVSFMLSHFLRKAGVGRMCGEVSKRQKMLCSEGD